MCSYMERKPTAFRYQSRAKAHVVAVDERAGIALSVHHREIHRLTSPGSPRLFASPCSVEENIEGHRGG